jgi:23S rRNA (cytosine1962-C5)-methyltransferase
MVTTQCILLSAEKQGFTLISRIYTDFRKPFRQFVLIREIRVKRLNKQHPDKTTAPLRLRVKAAAERSVRSGHPWIFAESISKQDRPGALGDLAVIYDRANRFLAAGLFDPESAIRVRVLHVGKPEPLDEQWWTARLRRALERRKGLFDRATTGYRCINGESDGFPGLILDRYEQTFVLKLYTAAWMPRLEMLLSLITELLRPTSIVLRLSRNIQQTAQRNFQRQDGKVVLGNAIEQPVTFRETGLQFETNVLHGQKTGFFLDQRENRRMVEKLAAGRSVLNAFSFSGGFSLYAARGGARATTDLDLSPHALASAQRNFALNAAIPQVAECRHELIQADAFEWLQARRRFDLIVLDPPSLAKRESERAGALRAYGRLITMAIDALSPKGVLVACSCSAHVTADGFFEVARHSAKRAGRRFEELQTTAHAPDHPATFKEAEYLKAIYLRFGE